MKIQKSKAAANFEVQILIQGQKYWSESMTTNEYGHCIPCGRTRYTADKVFKTLKLKKLDIETVKEFIINVFNYRKPESKKIENIEFDVSVNEIAKSIEDNGQYSEKVSDVNVIVPVADRKRMYTNFIGCKWRDMSNVKVKAIKIVKK
jgi:hypothetical protein